METIKNLDHIQINIKTFNENQKDLKNEFIKSRGLDAWNEIRDSGFHHPLKARRSVDYSLTELQLKELMTKGLTITDTDESFGNNYLQLYNNDMPVIITADSMLYAFHKFYDGYLKDCEETVLIKEFTTLCDKMLSTIYTVPITDANKELLAFLELYFVIPRTILTLNNKLSPVITTSSELLFDKATIAELFSKPTKERIDEELNAGYAKPGWSYICPEKLVRFCADVGLEYDKNEHWNYSNIINRSPKLSAAFNHYKIPDIDKPIMLKFNDKQVFDNMIKSIAEKNDIELRVFDVKIKLIGSLFTPRGHYTESVGLNNYFIAFSWLALFNLKIKLLDSNRGVSFMLASIISVVAKYQISELNRIQTFMQKIIGLSEGVNMVGILQLIDNYLPKFDFLANEIDWLLNNYAWLCDQVIKEDIEFTLLGQGDNMDNKIIRELIDDKLIEDAESRKQSRKFPSVYDLLYTVFNNKSVRDTAYDKMDNVYVQQMDGYQYKKHLDNLKQKCSNFEFESTIYSQELKMLRALVCENFNEHPFNSIDWLKKQAITQAGHYAEMRRDNCLYVKEVVGGCCECEYPDLLVEPMLDFWREFLKLVIMMKELHDDDILSNFESMIEMCIEYVELYIGEIPIPDDLIEKLKSIIKEHTSSGGAYYTGWYPTLFKSKNDFLEMKPEIGTWFTGQKDDRGPGGIAHLGTGPNKMMYLMSRNVVYMGPIYGVYSFLSSDKRYNDKDWGNDFKSYKSLVI